MDLMVNPAGSTFTRPGGRDGDWLGPPDPDDNDEVVAPFDFVLVPGADADAALSQLRRMRPDTWPMLLGSVYDAGILFEHIEVFDETPEDWLQLVKAVDLESWFQGQLAEVLEWQANSGGVIPPRGRWPLSVPPPRGLQIALEQGTEQPHAQVLIGLIPTDDAAAAPAHLHFGGWSDCPEPQLHVALARDWLARFGARPVAATYETLEFQVERPVRDREEAMRLALEHYHYNRESVPETLQDAAARLVGATVWHFSWD